MNENTANPAKTSVRSCCREKILRTRNCRRKFIKNFLPEKRKENMLTKQTQLKSRLKKLFAKSYANCPSNSYERMKNLTPCALRLVETFWLVETFVSECLNFN